MMAKCRRLGEREETRKNQIKKSTRVLTEKLGRKRNRAVRLREKEAAPQNRRRRILLSAENVIFWPLSPKVLENARRAEHADFFEEEGLKEFLHLDWDIEMDESLVRKFICNYHMHKRTVSMSTRETSVDDELLVEVFRLPSGTHCMSKTHKTKIISPYFPTYAGGDNGFFLADCTDHAWEDRFRFLDQVFSGLSTTFIHVPNNFVEFLQVERKKRNWLDVFRWYFQAEIARIRRAGVGALTRTRIGRHISLILAHLQNKKKLLGICPMSMGRNYEEPQSSRDREETDVDEAEDFQSSSDDDRAHEKNETEEQQGENEETEANKREEETHQVKVGVEQTGVDDQILRFHQGVDELFNVLVTEFRKENHTLKNQVELQKSECVNQVARLENQNHRLTEENKRMKIQEENYKTASANVNDKMKILLAECKNASRAGMEAVQIRRENESLQKEVEKSNTKWRKAEQAQEELEEKLKKEEEKLGKAEQARKELESQATDFFTNITKLGRITRMSTETSTSSGGKKAKAVTSPKKEDEGK